MTEEQREVRLKFIRELRQGSSEKAVWLVLLENFIRRFLLTPEQDQWLKDHNHTILGIISGGWSSQYAEETENIRIDWNTKLGIDVFM